MGDIAQLVLPFFGIIFLGFLAAKISPQPVAALGWMNQFVLYFALPALFFQFLSRTPVEELTEGSYIFGSLLATYLIFLIMFAGSLIMGARVPESMIKALAACYGNIGFMGPGIALLAFGEEAAVPIALIICVENIVHFAVAPTIMAIAGTDQPQGRLRLVGGIIRKIVLHPFILAAAAGALAAALQYEPPMAVSRLIEQLAGAAAPCALFAMGVTLALRSIKRVPAALAPITALKLVVHPMLCYVVLSVVGNFSPTWVYSAMLLAALPTATNVYVLATQYGVWIERASASVLVTTMISVVSVTSLLYAIQSGVLPPDLFP